MTILSALLDFVEWVRDLNDHFHSWPLVSLEIWRCVRLPLTVKLKVVLMTVWTVMLACGCDSRAKRIICRLVLACCCLTMNVEVCRVMLDVQRTADDINAGTISGTIFRFALSIIDPILKELLLEEQKKMAFGLCAIYLIIFVPLLDVLRDEF